MPIYPYRCPNCDNQEDVVLQVHERNYGHICHVCQCEMTREFNFNVGVTGTRDSFGIGKKFMHQGKEITNWKEWEKAGFRDAKDCHTGDVLEGIKRKEDKIKHDKKKKFSVKVK